MNRIFNRSNLIGKACLSILFLVFSCQNTNAKPIEQQKNITATISKEKILAQHNDALKKDKETDALFEQANLNQVEMNQISCDRYQVWDKQLNDLWTYLKQTLPKNEMKTLTQEQRKWIKQKEDYAKKEASDWEGGSMQTMIECGALTKQTRERVVELMRDYIQ